MSKITRAKKARKQKIIKPAGYPGETQILYPSIPREIDNYYENENTNPDHIYLNMLITNSNSFNVPLQFIENRSQAILRKPSDYACSVIRFQINSYNSIPLFLFNPIPGENVRAWSNTFPYSPGTLVYYLGYIYSNSIPIEDGPNIGNQPNISPDEWLQTTLNPNLNVGNYKVTLVYNGISYSEPLILTQITTNTDVVPVPSNWETLNPSNAFYYGIYYIETYITAINQALLSAYNRVPGTAPPKAVGAPAPYIQYENTTGILSLVAHRTFNRIVAGAPTIEIWADNNLFLKLITIPVDVDNSPLSDPYSARFNIYDKSNNLVSQPPPNFTPAPWQQMYIYQPGEVVYLSSTATAYQAINQNVDERPDLFPGDWAVYNMFVPPATWSNGTVYNVGNIVLYQGSYYVATAPSTGHIPTDPTYVADWTPYTGFDSYKMDTEYQQLYYWFDLTSIVFVGSLIPIVSEYVPANLGSSTSNVSDTNNNALGILTDFQFELNNVNDPRQNILYLPSAEYRMINLTSDTPLTSIQVSAYWTDRNNNYYPIYLFPKGQATLKFLFRKKHLIGKTD